MELSVAGRTVEITRPAKVLYPDAGWTKADVADYYRRVAEVMLPHLAGRPISMQRFPDGIDGEGFYHKQVPDYFPSWIHTEKLEKKEGGIIRHVVVDEAATLVYLANQATLTPHVWLSRCDRPDHPDRLVFDLDPAGDDFAPVRRAARWLRELLDELELPSFLMTTGSRGLHVVVPLDRGEGFDAVRSLAQEMAGRLAGRHPEALTTEARKAERGGRLLLDVARNGYAQTAVAPYALRPRPGAPVATPLAWDELDRGDLDARSYHLGNLFRRLGQRNDPWAAIDESATGLAAARRRLGQLDD